MLEFSLFSPKTVQGKEFRNRIIMPPMASEKATESGEVTEKHLDYYRERGKEGLGGIIVEHAFVSETGRFSKHQLSAADDKMLEGLSSLAQCINNTSAVSILQINHAGALAYNKKNVTPIAPSQIAPPNNNEVTPREISIEEIEEIKAQFVAAAKRAVKAGFNGIELHGAHGYLLNQFNSPLTNLRQDEYGGSRNNRARLSLEIASEVKKSIGDKLLLYRLGAVDSYAKGLTVPDAIWLSKELMRAGVDIVDVSGGHGGYRGNKEVQGYFVPVASEIKHHLPAPVIVSGGITTPKYAEQVVSQEGIDFVGIGRALLSRPDWPSMARKELFSSN